VLIPDRLRAGHVDTTAELGHWLEICQLQPQDIEFLERLVADHTSRPARDQHRQRRTRALALAECGVLRIRAR
jgi:hypothetical protein